jgi:hypothetical protein
VAHAASLGVEVAGGVWVVDAHEHGDTSLDLDPEGAELLDLVGVVGHEPDRLDAQLGQHRRSDVVPACVVGQTEDAVRVDRVGTLGLQGVRADLVRETDASSLLAQVQDRTLTATGDLGLGGLELLLAVALERAEDLAGQALAMDTHGDGALAANGACHDGNGLFGQAERMGRWIGPAEYDGFEVAKASGNNGSCTDFEPRPDHLIGDVHRVSPACLLVTDLPAKGALGQGSGQGVQSLHDLG